MTELFTFKDYKTLTHKGIIDLKASDLITWFNVDGKTNADSNKTTFLDHVDHRTLFTSDNVGTWTNNLFEEINGKTYMNYPSASQVNLIHKTLVGDYKIVGMEMTFIVDSLTNAYVCLATSQGAGTKLYGGITIWLDTGNKIRVESTFKNSSNVLAYFSQNVGSAVLVGVEYTVKVTIDEATKQVIVDVNGISYPFTYDSTWTMYTSPRDIIIGGRQGAGSDYPPADFKLHELKVYKGV